MDSGPLRVTPLQNMTSAFVGATVTSLVMTPLDVVKTRLQMQQGNVNKFYFYCNGLTDHLCPTLPKEDVWYRKPSKFNGTLDGMLKIIRQEGMFSLWSGLSPTLVLALPTTVLYMALFEEIKFQLMDHYSRDRKQPLWIPFLSASTARFFTTVVAGPLELIRTKMQAKRMSYLEIHRATLSLVRFKGLGGLWKGVSATLVRDISFSGIYWVVYESLKQILDNETKPTFTKSFLAGSTAGVISAVVTTPFDVVKTHVQLIAAEEILTEAPTKHKIRVFSTICKICTQNGLRGLFVGVVPRTIRVAPSCAILIATFECGKRFFQDYNKKIELGN
ncbi:probable mitochondrial glutathione transporter SLC25A40 [Macrosteles quadrilineatus]|uniref:probable mitochondrial glutathione transporter SLC25A40 n=1 Tax=Macrosteles quadrilineatus TaxID=74068 RepID=UPI0023E153F9|nr:probable mitochondrial glutathione transporter SLC25A40 [Macrosteles quadrilineatus]